MLTDAKAPEYVGDSTSTLSPGLTSMSKLCHTNINLQSKKCLIELFKLNASPSSDTQSIS